MKNFKPYNTKNFNNIVQKFQTLKKQIASKVRQLLKDPYRAAKSEQLVGNVKGLRSALVTRSMRIIFAICDECRQNCKKELVGYCSEICEQMDDDVVIFLTFDVYDKVYTPKPKPD